MCVSSTPSAPVAKTSYRDTSQDPIISNYELSDAQKAENKRRRAAKRSKSLVSFSDNGGTGTGVSFSGSVFLYEAAVPSITIFPRFLISCSNSDE